CSRPLETTGSGQRQVNLTFLLKRSGNRPGAAIRGVSMTARILVNIDVDDLAKATEFYCKAFNLHVGRRFGADAVELLGSTSPIYLLVKPNGTVASATSRHLRSYARHWTPVHLDFVVDEI